MSEDPEGDSGAGDGFQGRYSHCTNGYVLTIVFKQTVTEKASFGRPGGFIAISSFTEAQASSTQRESMVWSKSGSMGRS